MKRILLMLAVLIWMSMSAAAVLAAAPRANQPRRPKPLPQAYAWMLKDLSLTEDQQEKIGETLKPSNVEKVTTELLKPEQEKVSTLEKELGVAVKEKNGPEAKSLKAQIVAAKADVKAAKGKLTSKVQDKLEAEIMSVLTAEQKAKWAVHNAMPDVRTGIKPVTLTQEQAGKVRTLCEEASTALLAAWGSEKIDEWKGVIQGIVDDVKANILTEQQQKQLPKEKAPASRQGQ